MLIYYDIDTQSANFPGNPFRQATKRPLNNRTVVKNNENEMTSSSVWPSCCLVQWLFSPTTQPNVR